MILYVSDAEELFTLEENLTNNKVARANSELCRTIDIRTIDRSEQIQQTNVP